VSGIATAGRGASPGVRFPLAKFRPTTLPATLVTRPPLHERLAGGAGKRLTVVVGSAGAGKSVLLSSWAATGPPGTTSWLSCSRADADPVRFWLAFIEAPRIIAPGFSADAADLLAIDGVMSADVTASTRRWMGTHLAEALPSLPCLLHCGEAGRGSSPPRLGPAPRTRVIGSAGPDGSRPGLVGGGGNDRSEFVTATRRG
jgi:hypothetical protein